MNKFDLVYGIGTPKPSVIPDTFVEKSPMELIADIHEVMEKAWKETSNVPRHMTIAVPTGKTMRKVYHYKGRRYVTRYSMHDILSGWFK